MTFTFRTIYTYCGAIPDLAGQWYMIESGPHSLTFIHHQHRWKMKLTPEVAAKVMREPT